MLGYTSKPLRYREGEEVKLYIFSNSDLEGRL